MSPESEPAVEDERVDADAAESGASGSHTTESDPTDPSTNGESADVRPAPGAESAADDQGMIDADDLFVTRDPETDEVRPRRVQVAGYGDAKVRQLNYGDGEKYFGDSGAVADVGPGVIAEILREHVVDPELERHVKEKYGQKVRQNARGDTAGPPPYLNAFVVREEMKPFVPMVFLRTILAESGMPTTNVQMNEDGSATVQFDESAEGNR